MKSLKLGLIVAAALYLAPAAQAQSVSDTLCSTLGVGCPPTFTIAVCNDAPSCTCPAGYVAVNGGGLCSTGATPQGWGPVLSLAGAPDSWRFFCSGFTHAINITVLCQKN